MKGLYFYLKYESQRFKKLIGTYNILKDFIGFIKILKNFTGT